MPRGLDELKEALEEQAGSSDGSRELLVTSAMCLTKGHTPARLVVAPVG